jgi:hypothetical protein
VADANVLALPVRTTARLALRPDPTDAKINEASKRAAPEDTAAKCKVCGASPYQHCFMPGAFQGCPRDLRRLPVVLPNPAKDDERVLT